MAVYVLGDWEQAKRANQLSKTSGRTQLTDKLKKKLVDKYGCKCHLYGEEYPERLLQPNHRVPYEIGGDPEDMLDTDYFMLLCPSANRDKYVTIIIPNFRDDVYKNISTSEIQMEAAKKQRKALLLKGLQ